MIANEKLHQPALAAAENFRKAEFELIDVLQKIAEAKTYLALGYPNLFAYAVEALKLSEANAYSFTSIAKKSREIPAIKEEIRAGNLSVAKARRVISVITPQNQKEWIEKAVTLPKVKLEQEVAKINPEPVRETVRPVSEDRFALKVGISQSLLKKFRRIQTLVSQKKRRVVSLEEALEAAADLMIEREDPVVKAERAVQKNKLCPGTISNNTKSTSVSKQVPPERDTLKNVPLGGWGQRKSISSFVLHQIRSRDGGQCTYRSPTGVRCASQSFIELHHRQHVANGGADSVENLTTLCSAHHRYLHELGT